MANRQSAGPRPDANGARAFAMFAIVIGHVAYSFVKNNVRGFEEADKDLVYNVINLPGLFMFVFLAGMVQALAIRPARSLQEYLAFERSKLLRLMLPYVSVSLLTLGIKVAAPANALPLERVPHSLGGLVICPRSGPSAHLWFLYWLMSLLLIWPLVVRVARGIWVPVLLGALALLAILPIPWPLYPRGSSYLGLGNLSTYTVVFALGYFYAIWSRGLLRMSYPAMAIVGAAFVGLLLVHCCVPLPASGYAARTLRKAVMMGFLTAGAVFYLWLAGLLAALLPRFRRAFSELAFHSYDIYLLHLAFVVHPMIYLLSKLEPGRTLAYALLVPLTLMAICISVLLGKGIRRVPIAAFVLLGAPIKKASPKRAVPAT